MVIAGQYSGKTEDAPGSFYPRLWFCWRRRSKKSEASHERRVSHRPLLQHHTITLAPHWFESPHPYIKLSVVNVHRKKKKKSKMSCLPGYMGTYCEIDVDDCESNPCVNDGICRDMVNGFTCTCQPGKT